MFVGADKENLMQTSSTQSVMGVCESFGKYIKFTVDIDEAAGASSRMPVLNAFAVITAAQKQLQVGDSGVPFAIPVKTNKDKLIEELYFSCGFEPICVHYTSESVEETPDSTFLPHCEECKHLEKINRPQKRSILLVGVQFFYN